MKQIVYTSTAWRSLRKLPAKVRAQIEAKLQRYAECGEGDVKTLTGSSHARLRSGDYRVIFGETDIAIQVMAVGHRRDIYR